MGALPKNKITRVERGKRRAGNTPKLVKDTNTKAPLHKQGFVAEFLQFIGLETKPAAKTAAPAKTETKSAAKTKAAPQAPQAGRTARPTQGGKQAAGKTVRKAQHKG
jgi:hypothetical protein